MSPLERLVPQEILSTSPLERFVSQGNSTCAHNHPNFLPFLIFEKILRLITKKIKKFYKYPWTFLLAYSNGFEHLLFGFLLMDLDLA